MNGWRTVLIGRNSKLDYHMGYMTVRSTEIKRIFLDEIAVLVIENPAISMTGCLLEALVEHKVKVLFCDGKHNPMAELTPLHDNYSSSLVIRRQISWREETKGLVWQNIIRAKISLQADLLQQTGHIDEEKQLRSYLPDVVPEDASNREGFAAKVYFNALFGMDFKRREDDPINAALNYGYAVLLSIVNREITAAGYLTQLGVFHENQFNPFNLSCDLMEPFRILIDQYVLSRLPKELTGKEKHDLWTVFHESVRIDGTNQTVLNAVKLYVHSVLRALDNDAPDNIPFYSLP